MPRDQRLYMTFPIDFHRHPKLRKLPVEVRWTFVEMNGEARLADNDGRFDEDEAEFMWSKDHLESLCKSHPSRPLVLHENGVYVIRDYAEHQETRAAREERVRRNTENGRKGGRPRKNPAVTDPQPSGFRVGTDPQPTETQAKAESESEDYLLRSRSQSRDTRANLGTDELSEVSRGIANRAGITSIPAVVEAIRKHTARQVSAQSALQVALWILEKPKTVPRAPQRYVTGAIARSPFEVQQWIDQQGLEAVA